MGSSATHLFRPGELLDDKALVVRLGKVCHRLAAARVPALAPREGEDKREIAADDNSLAQLGKLQRVVRDHLEAHAGLAAARSRGVGELEHQVVLGRR